MHSITYKWNLRKTIITVMWFFNQVNQSVFLFKLFNVPFYVV